MKHLLFTGQTFFITVGINQILWFVEKGRLRQVKELAQDHTVLV